MSSVSASLGSSRFRPFRLRYLAAVLNRLNDLPEDVSVGATVAEWCRREEVFFETWQPAGAVRVELSRIVFSEMPSLSLA